MRNGSRRALRVLILSHSLPFPPVGGGPTRTYHLVRALAREFDVEFLGFSYPGDTVRCDLPIRLAAVEWEWPELYRKMRDGDEEVSARAAGALAAPDADPWQVSVLDSPAMTRAVTNSAQDADVVIVGQLEMARFLRDVPPSVAKVLDLHDVFNRMLGRARQTWPEASEAHRVAAFERRAAATCDLCLVCSELEAKGLRAVVDDARVEVVRNGVDTSFFAPVDWPTQPGRLLFTGRLDYAPNLQAVEYFVREILPLVHEQRPEVTLDVVGFNPPDDLRRLSSPSVNIVGSVDDVRPYFGAAEQVVVPLLEGGGTRLKILEAAASGKAVVSTSLGAEGLELGEDAILCCDSPEAFARAVVMLGAAESRRRELGANARQAALQYDWDTIGRRLCDGVAALAAARVLVR